MISQYAQTKLVLAVYEHDNLIKKWRGKPKPLEILKQLDQLIWEIEKYGFKNGIAQG